MADRGTWWLEERLRHIWRALESFREHGCTGDIGYGHVASGGVYSVYFRVHDDACDLCLRIDLNAIIAIQSPEELRELMTTEYAIGMVRG